METAAAETEQAESRLVAEETATRNRGEDTNAAAALNLDEWVSTTAAQNLGEDTNAAVACNLIEDTNPQQPKKKQRTEVTSRSQGNKNKWNNEGDDEIRKTHGGEAKHCERRQTTTERTEQEDQKVHQ